VPLRAPISNEKVNACRRQPPDFQIPEQVRRVKSTVSYIASSHAANILGIIVRRLLDVLLGLTMLVASFSGTLYRLDHGSMDFIKKLNVPDPLPPHDDIVFARSRAPFTLDANQGPP
jgi:hypothetical protein